MEVTGFDGKECVLSHVIIDQLDGAASEEEPVVAFTPEADTDRARDDIEIPIAASGSYSVRFILRDPNGTELDRWETDPFDVT